MAALVEPLGLERGKRARGPCPPEPRFPPLPRKARAGVGGAPPVGRSMGVGGSGRVRGRTGWGGAPAAHPRLGAYGDSGRSLSLATGDSAAVLPGVCLVLVLTRSLAASLDALRLGVSLCIHARPRPADVSRAVELLERLQRSGELPPQKLQALQRVLQSRFCSAIREVSPAWRRGPAGSLEPWDYASQQGPGRAAWGCPRVNSGFLWEL